MDPFPDEGFRAELRPEKRSEAAVQKSSWRAQKKTDEEEEMREKMGFFEKVGLMVAEPAAWICAAGNAIAE